MTFARTSPTMVSFCLALPTFLVLACGVYADLIYRDLGDVAIFDGTYDLDINLDGVTDFVFESVHASQFWIMPEAGNEAIVNGSGDLAPLTNGFDISLSLSPPYSWSSNSVIGISAFMTLPPPDGETGIGEFFGQTAFMGLEFSSSGSTHYAWVRLAHSDLGAGGYLVDLAYETTPDTGLATGAGVIQEPGTVCLLCLGLGVLAVQVRRRHRPPVLPVIRSH